MRYNDIQSRHKELDLSKKLLPLSGGSAPASINYTVQVM
jgi:hypothetical protein